MHSINPYLRAFYKSNLLSQCNPVSSHVLLVPTTECLLTGRDREANSSYVDLASSEDFLASHVLRIPDPQPGDGSFRDSRGKAKQYNTINGRTVVVKESFLYSNKGFRNLNQAQLLNDHLYYTDGLDSQQWLVYYISKPLVGSYESVKITPAILPSAFKSNSAPRNDGTAGPATPSKKEVESFNDLLNQFPMIARQMQSGLEKVVKDFHKAINDWVPTGLSRSSSAFSQRPPKSPSVFSNGSLRSDIINGHLDPPIPRAQLAEEAGYMRTNLESAVNAAIELFQKVDKQQLSFLASSTLLTGPVVEKMIERYVTEQLHDAFLFPRLCNSSKFFDFQLESNVHAMQHIDIAQVGIAIVDGREQKGQLVSQIAKGVEEFRKLGVASSPQQMLEVLLTTQKLVTGQQRSKNSGREAGPSNNPLEKPSTQTMNADTLVSLVLIVVIRAQVRHLHARLAYMRDFVFIDDVDSGEAGYALSTFEAVLSYLSTDSAGLRKASSRNRKLWQAAKKGDVGNLRSILEASAIDDQDAPFTPTKSDGEKNTDEQIFNLESRDYFGSGKSMSNADSAPITPTECGNVSESSTLAHVFPFQASQETPKMKKKVSMDMRSLSNASEFSFISQTTTIDSTISAIDGDTSVETLAQTQDVEGNSVPMMAIEARQVHSLEYLLSLEHFYPARYLLDDANVEGTTLLMAAIQLNSPDIIDILLKRLFEAREKQRIFDYFARTDNRGRTAAHYLFHAPWLLPRIGELLPWTKKDKTGQTPLLALCRSYDHPDYSDMLNVALGWAAHQQGSDQPLHLDDHVDGKGNTLLHVVSDPVITARLLQHCDSDPNATNDRLFTPLMSASKFGRMDVVRALFGDPRVDFLAKEQRGLTAVELAKDDEIRNRIDDMVLVSDVPARDGRVTAVVRSFFVEDASVRMILKSATRTNNMISITTGRRSLTDFMNLAKWLALEHPASWLPSIFKFRSPFQIASRPSKAVLQDIQTRLDRFLKIMLAHATFSTHELLWEFILFPEIQLDMMAERSRKKAEIRGENILEEYEPVDDVREVSSFVDHARESLRGIDHATKRVTRRVVAYRLGHSNIATAISLLSSDFSTLQFLPQTHLTALQRYATCLQPAASDPMKTLHSDLLALYTTILAILSCLSRPHTLMSQLNTIQKSIDRHVSSSRRSDRWPLALLDETRADAAAKAEEGKGDLRRTGCELMYTWQTVAGELAGWQDLHALMGRRAIKTLARGMVVREKDRLEGMKRALRVIQKEKR